MKRFLKIFRFELAQQLQSISTWIYFSVLFAFPIFMNVLTTPGDGVYPNNTFHIISVAVAGVFIWLVMGAAIAGEAASRDLQKNMHPLTYTTPISKFQYLGGRFGAALAVNALLVLALPLSTLLSFAMRLDDGDLLPFRPAVYLNVYFLIVLPSAFLATALQFSFAALSRQVMTSYLASLLLAIFPQLIAVTLASLLGNWSLLTLLDPIGVAGIIGSELSTWTPSEKNTRLVMPEGMFLANRMLWLGVGLLCLVFTFARFSFDHTTSSKWFRFKKFRKAEDGNGDSSASVRTGAMSPPYISLTFRFSTYLRQALFIARASFIMIVKSPAGITLVSIVVFVAAAFASKILSTNGIPLLPTTTLVLNFLTAPVGAINSPWVIIPLLIMYLAGQLVWRERDFRMNDIADATPVTEWALVTGKFLGLALVIVTWMIIMMAGGIVMQLLQGYTNLEVTLYLKVLFGLQLIDYLLFAMLALAVHVIVNNKSIGFMVLILIFFFLAFPSTFRVSHSMLVFGAGPRWSYGDMQGFGFTIMPWLWFRLYWIAWTLLLALVARLLWTRGKENTIRHRLNALSERFIGPTQKIAAIGTVMLITLGSFVFYNTNVLNAFLTPADINAMKAQYELKYGKYRDIPQPRLTGTKLDVEIYPEQQRVKVHAVYTLVNSDTVAIDSIHLGGSSTIILSDVKINGFPASVLEDEKLSHYIYALQQSLQPGDSLQIEFDTHLAQQGFSHAGAGLSIAKNGTYLTNYDLLPAVGYMRSKEISDAVARKQYNLPPRAAIPSLYDMAARSKPLSNDRNTFEAVVSTTIGQIAVAPGSLQRTWAKDGRSYFHYKTDGPIRGEFAFFSAAYAVKQSTWKNVSINIYFHPHHHGNIDRMLRSVKASMAYYTEHFGPYPYSHLTIVEHAGAEAGAHAEASVIDYGEQYSLMNPDDSPEGFDLPYYILAHEAAHQWFGSAQFNPAGVEGAGVLIEGLAVYAGMQVLQKNYGDVHLQQYLNFLHSFYEMPRSLATNSLLQADEPFLYYRKGGLAMHVLGKYIGQQKINGALRNLLQQHVSGALPSPTTLDLYREVEQVTPDSLNYLLSDLFETNTYWRLKTKKVSTEKTSSGTWTITLEVNAQKFTVDSTGKEHTKKMNDWLEIGIYESAEGITEPMYCKMHRIHGGDQTIEVVVPRKPKRAGIDPNGLMLDIRRDDNVMVLED